MHPIYWNIRTPLRPDRSTISYADFTAMKWELKMNRVEYRWTPRKKAMVVCLLVGWIISYWEAEKEFELWIEELIDWKKKYEWGGLWALRVSEQENRTKDWIQQAMEWAL